MVSFFKKGQIWWYDNGNAHKQDYYNTEGNCDILDPRPILIVQNAVYDKWDKTITVIILTGSENRVGIEINDFNNNGKFSRVLPYKMLSVSPRFLKDYMGTLDKPTMSKVDKWIKYHFGYTKIKPPEVEAWDNAIAIANEMNEGGKTSEPIKKRGGLKKLAKPLLSKSGDSYKVSKVYNRLSYDDKLDICSKSIELLSKKLNMSRTIAKEIRQIIIREKYEIITKDGTAVEFIPIIKKIELIDRIGDNIKSYKFKFEEQKVLFSIPDDELSLELRCDIADIKNRKMEITNKGIL